MLCVSEIAVAAGTGEGNDWESIAGLQCTVMLLVLLLQVIFLEP